MKDWSKLKVFLLLILLIGTVIHLTVNLSYFSLYRELAVKGISETLFLISAFFIIFSTFIFTKKISGFLKRLFGGMIIVVFQLCLFILVSLPFFFVDGMMDFFTPEFIQGDEKFGHSVARRFYERYGIDLVETQDILHSSYYRVGEEFGYDIIFRVKSTQVSKYSPEGVNFNLLQTNAENTPFRFYNRQFICGDNDFLAPDDEGIKIRNEEIRRFICDTKEFPSNTLIAEKWVRLDWTITSVFFPNQKVLWATEIEW